MSRCRDLIGAAPHAAVALFGTPTKLPLSRSPRRSIRMAAAELADLAAICERYPERRAELVAILGEDLMRQVDGARDTLERAARCLDASNSLPDER
jgi:hypothetical protein